MSKQQQPHYYETRRDAPDGNVTRRGRGRLRVFAVYSDASPVGLEDREVEPNIAHGNGNLEQGHGGKECEDLARTIIGDWLHADAPHRLVYSRFKSMLISPAPQDVPLKITAEQIEGFFKLVDGQGRVR